MKDIPEHSGKALWTALLLALVLGVVLLFKVHQIKLWFGR